VKAEKWEGMRIVKAALGIAEHFCRTFQLPNALTPPTMYLGTISNPNEATPGSLISGGFLHIRSLPATWISAVLAFIPRKSLVNAFCEFCREFDHELPERELYHI